MDLKGAAPPRSTVRNISLENIKGRFGTLGTIKPNPGQTEIGDILLKDIDLQLASEGFEASGAGKLRLENVVVNGKPFSV